MSREFDQVDAEVWKARAATLEAQLLHFEGRITMLFAHISQVERANNDLQRSNGDLQYQLHLVVKFLQENHADHAGHRFDASGFLGEQRRRLHDEHVRAHFDEMFRMQHYVTPSVKLSDITAS